MNNCVRSPRRSLVLSKYSFSTVIKQSLLSGGKPLTVISCNWYPGRVCLSKSPKRTLIADLDIDKFLMSISVSDWHLWLVRSAVSVVALYVSLLKSICLTGESVFKKLRTMVVSQVTMFLGMAGFIINIPFRNLTTRGCEPTGVSLIYMNDDKADLIVFIVL